MASPPSATANAPLPSGQIISGPADESTPLLEGRDAEAAQETSNSEPSQAKQLRWLSLGSAILLGIILIAIVILVVILKTRSDDMQSPGALCLTPACIHAADKLLSSLSPKREEIDPCTNFAEYVCGGWLETHDLRPDQSTASSFSTIAEDADTVIRHILEGSYPGDSSHSAFSPLNLAVNLESADQDNFNTLKRAYNACMSVDTIKEAGLKPLQDLLQAMPTLDNALNLSAPILYLEKLGISSFVNLYADADDKDPETIVVFAGPSGSYGLPNPYYERKDVVSEYQTVVEKVFDAMKLTNSEDAASSPSKVAASVVALESQLAAAAPSPDDLYDVTKSYNPMSLKDTAKLAPAIGIDHVLHELIPSNYTVDRMITQFPEFFGNVTFILSQTTKKTLQHFFQWKLIMGAESLVIAPELAPLTRFQNKMKGKEPDATTDRWRTCNNAMDGSLPWLLSRFYVEAAFSEKAKSLGDKIVSDIKRQFISGLDSYKWMDDSVKKLATDKVNAIVQKIGYPAESPNIMDPEELQRYYAPLNITNEHFANSVAAQRWDTKKSWAKLGKPVDHGTWDMSAPTVNAYYSPAGNEIVFPAGIMHYPMFGEDLPMYINYGAFGAVAGHELSHAFDNNGRHYDVHGRYTDWWTNSTVAEFEKRAQCFIEEYNNMTVEGARGTEHVNGKQTLGENLADAGGLNAAYKVWKQHARDNKELALPGLESFSLPQLFFLSYGNVWCTKATKEYLTRAILTDPHAPGSLRPVGSAMMNSRDFREAFQCPTKEPVCELW